MDWIKKYQLFLFDFDGLLVNTEEIHYQAYFNMMKNRGIHMTWSFDRYCQAAHYGATALRDQFYQEFPKLKTLDADWKTLYSEKQQEIIRLVRENGAHFMPGAEDLLKRLREENIKRVVVTHSPKVLIDAIIHKNPLLATIPYWITRESYSEPKPNPECYQKALKEHSSPGDRVIGFEDTPRGLRALLPNPVTAVLICQTPYPEIQEFVDKGVKHYPSFTNIPPSGP